MTDTPAPSTDGTVTPAAPRRAYVFYATNDTYAVAVLVFVRLLRQLGIRGDTDVVVLHLTLSEHLLVMMESMQIVTRRVPAPALVRDRLCRHCLVKLRVLGLTDYERVVYVDADAIPLRPLDHLLELRFAEPLAAPTAYWLPQPCWGSHLLVVKPSAELWARVERRAPSAADRGLHDMDIVNLELGREIHSLPGETACLNSEWEDAGRPGAFGDPQESYARAAVVHFTALGKPWAHTPEDVRRLRPKAHPIFYRLWETWWEARDEIFRPGGSSAEAGDTGSGRGHGRVVAGYRNPGPRRRRAAGEDVSPGGRDAMPEGGGRSSEPPSQRSVRGTPITLHRAVDFHQWFARAYQHHLGVRYRTFFEALMLALSRNATNIVETGTIRLAGNWAFDGQSTRVFGAFAERYGCKLWTCDATERHIELARDLTAPFARQIEYVVSDSVAFLERFSEPIDLLYLDAVDFDADAPAAAQDHALREGQAALHALHDDSIVLIDDCGGVPHGGKGATVIPFLLGHGWQVARKRYQVLLTRNAGGGP